ncbi:MAG: hypothetical protein ACRECV_10365 [Xanthobacteraceae bacterium]
MDEIALAIGELARYIEDVEKDKLIYADTHKALRSTGARLLRSLAPRRSADVA